MFPIVPFAPPWSSSPSPQPLSDGANDNDGVEDGANDDDGGEDGANDDDGGEDDDDDEDGDDDDYDVAWLSNSQ